MFKNAIIRILILNKYIIIENYEVNVCRVYASKSYRHTR